MATQPASVEEAADAVRSHARVRVAGARTKGRLCEAEGELLEMTALRGITEYEASEYTFTALAGTPVAEVVEALAQRGQHLPFDPLLVRSGATLGGTVASGISGPGRFRYGGLRDFLIGVQFIDGSGRLIRGGGKVVKNAAGFDFPKFMVGSLGRFGALTELTFKVFPAAPAQRTIRISCRDAPEAVERLAAIARSRWEAEALEWSPASLAIHVRLGGPAAAVVELAGEICSQWPGDAEVLADDEAMIHWGGMGEKWWAGDDQVVVKVPITPSRIAGLEERLPPLPETDHLYSCGGAVAWIALPPARVEELNDVLRAEDLPGLVVMGGGENPLWLGRKSKSEVALAVKKALDPEGRFPAL